jgi:hypothetical protein
VALARGRAVCVHHLDLIGNPDLLKPNQIFHSVQNPFIHFDSANILLKINLYSKPIQNTFKICTVLSSHPLKKFNKYKIQNYFVIYIKFKTLSRGFQSRLFEDKYLKLWKNLLYYWILNSEVMKFCYIFVTSYSKNPKVFIFCLFSIYFFLQKYFLVNEKN